MRHIAFSLALSLSLSEWSVRRCSDYASLQMDASVNSTLAEMLITIIYSLKKYEEGELLSHDKKMLFLSNNKNRRWEIPAVRGRAALGPRKCRFELKHRRCLKTHKDANTPLYQVFKYCKTTWSGISNAFSFSNVTFVSGTKYLVFNIQRLRMG